MNISDWLQQSTKGLEEKGIDTARLDCLVILEDLITKDRSWILAHQDEMLTDEQLRKLDEQLEQRGKHTPLAYIRGKTEFYGREFLINEYVLEPRPESETIIELLKQSVTDGAIERIIDVGTGSGALAITAKLEIPAADIIAIDIDKNCLELAQRNAIKHKADVNCIEGNLLAPPRQHGR